MASKNNPNMRAHEKLYTYCPTDSSELKIVKKIPGGMFYKCEQCEFTSRITKGSYRNMNFEWKSKK